MVTSIRSQARIVIIGLVFVLGIFCTYRFFFASVVKRTLTISIDQCCAASVAKLVHENLNALTNYHPQAIVAQIQQDCPIVNKTGVRYLADGSIHIAVSVAQPALLLDDDKIITRTGLLYDADLFTVGVRAELPMIRCVRSAETIKDEDALLQCVGTVKEDFFKEYNLIWRNRHHVEVSKKDQKDISLLVRSEMLNENQTSKTISTLFEKLLSNEKICSKKNVQWIADARFDHQIILSQVKKGAY